MMGSTVDFLNRLAGTGTGSGAVAARRLATALSALAKADPPVRQRAETVFVQPLHTALDDLRDLFKAHEVTLDNLPPDLKHQWVTSDGQARIDVAPSRRFQQQYGVAEFRERGADRGAERDRGTDFDS